MNISGSDCVLNFRHKENKKVHRKPGRHEDYLNVIKYSYYPGTLPGLALDIDF